MYASNQPRWQSLLYLSSALTSTAFVWALATSSPARAQTPVPPNPALPYVVQQQGTNGNPGNDADPYQGTTNGQPGNAPSADINLLFPGNFTAIGASKSPLIQLSTIGGNGGRGGTAANVETGNGGDGGGGANSGNITATFDETQSTPNQPILIGNNGTGEALSIVSQGGSGGDGGAAGNSGQGGVSGVGGTAGTITVNINPPPSGIDPVAISTIPGVPAIILLSMGGNSGNAGDGSSKDVGEVTGPTAANAGAGGAINANIVADVDFGITAESLGGNAGNGGTANSDLGSGTGGNGGVGGAGGPVTLTLGGGRVRASGATTSGTGPTGLFDLFGNPTKTVSVNTSLITAAVLAISQGGLGGNGGDGYGTTSARAGSGGQAGAGGDVTVEVGATTIQTQNYGAIGVAAISVGGAGGDGAQASALFRSTGGNGAPGGNGGIVAVQLGQPGTGYQLLTTSGADSDALLGLSVGGGGGYGGDVFGGSIGFGATLGGHGANGGDGGQVIVDNGYWYQPIDGSAPYLESGYVVSTTGADSRGIGAESVGGGGGRGGDAFSATEGLVSLAIGGVGGQGGDGGTVTAQNLGIVQTSGGHSVGIDAMSVGGGGGDGGAAMSVAANLQFTAAAAVGGSGGTGGVGGAVQAYNLGQVLTFGGDAYGIRAQSVGGGGGEGGASVAAALQSVASDEIPSISLSVSLGGSGGNGGAGGAVEVLNAGLLGTSGNGAVGMLAQSVGGGGGTGGDSTALQTAYNAANINIAVAIGGSGGKGGNADSVTAFNSGLLYTLGAMAPGVMAQSIGGGGGNGGYGVVNSGSYNGASGPSLTATVAVGGSGNTGGDGGSVTVYNYVTPTLVPPSSIEAPPGINPNIYGGGAILTYGDGSAGIIAQSVGGGGGNGGHAVADGSGGSITVNIGVGGTGGAGGSGGAVLVDNGTGAILTTGANADGIFAQSVGGGGGVGGHAATGAGANLAYALEKYIGNNLAQALGIDPSQAVVNVATGIWDWKDNVVGTYNTLQRLQQISNGYAAQNDPLATPAESETSDSGMTVTIGGGWGGKGGAGGNGGTVTVDSAGSIETDGPMSAGIFAQSVGGGGGDGGAANPATSGDQISATSVKGSIAVGGAGGSSGDGGAIDVANSGLIETQGDLSFAVLAQSIGGGGGIGGATAATSASDSAMKVSVGGGNASSGTGGAVTIGNSGAISTQGESAYGILAQSIGGGGGLASVFGTRYDPTTGGADSLLSGASAPTQAAFAVGGGAGSTGGAVTVNATGGSIQTAGVNASAIVAQSVGGGGGIIAADNLQAVTTSNVFSSISRGAAGGTVSVTTSAGANITTSGDGAAGILAQSLGGGGIVQGLDNVGPENPIEVVKAVALQSGGPVSVTLNSTIVTKGAFAAGIFAQSSALGGVVGGTNNNGFIFAGVPGGPCSCDNGVVQVTLNPSSEVLVSGLGAYGVALIANGNTGGLSATNLVVDGGKIVASGLADGAIYVGGTFGNTVTIKNGATIDASQALDGFAIGVWGYNNNGGEPPYKGTVTIDNSTVKGSVALGDGSTLTNGAGSSFQPGAQVYLGPDGVLTNNGTINIGGVGKIATTTVTGNFVQGATGVLQIDANNATGQADLLAVQGSADVAGTVLINSTNLSNSPITVLTATGGVTLEPGLRSTPAYAFTYNTSVVGNAIQVQPEADFITAANGLSATSQRLAAHLQQIWDSGASLDGGFSALASINDPQSFASSLNSIGGAVIRGVAATRQAATERFFDNMVSCDTFKPGASPFEQGNCGWLRVVGAETNVGTIDGDPGYHQSSLTYQTGGQYEFAPGWFIGGSLAYEQSQLTGSAATVSGQSGLAGLMIERQAGPWLLTGALDGGFGGYQSTRQISVGGQTGTAAATPDVFNLGAHVRAAYQMALSGGAYIQPSVTLGTLYTNMAAYNETGSTSFNLHVRGSGNVTASVSPVVELGVVRTIDAGHAVRAFVDVGAAAYSNNDWSGEANLELAPAGTGTFTVNSRLPSAVGKVRAGVDLYAGDHLNLRLSYSASAASGFLSQSLIARLSYMF